MAHWKINIKFTIDKYWDLNDSNGLLTNFKNHY